MESVNMRYYVHLPDIFNNFFSPMTTQCNITKIVYYKKKWQQSTCFYITVRYGQSCSKPFNSSSGYLYFYKFYNLKCGYVDVKTVALLPLRF
jgi:hypothetical protein